MRWSSRCKRFLDSVFGSCGKSISSPKIPPEHLQRRNCGQRRSLRAQYAGPERNSFEAGRLCQFALLRGEAAFGTDQQVDGRAGAPEPVQRGAGAVIQQQAGAVALVGYFQPFMQAEDVADAG